MKIFESITVIGNNERNIFMMKEIDEQFKKAKEGFASLNTNIAPDKIKDKS